MRAAPVIVLLAGLGCAGGNPLSVDVRSDLAPGVEVARFEVELYDGPPPAGVPVPFDRVIARAADTDDYLEGVRAAEFDDVEDGRRWVEVAAIDPDGRVLLRQPAEVLMAGRTARVVILDRQCVGVECPGAGGSPSDLACLAGRCVDPRCTPSAPEHCPDWVTCDRDADCDAPAASCATARCADSFCFAVVQGGACAEELWCNPDDGCTPLPGVERDAGTPTVDGGCEDLPCTLDDPCLVGIQRCGGSSCEVAGNALEGSPCDGGACDGFGACVVP